MHNFTNTTSWVKNSNHLQCIYFSVIYTMVEVLNDNWPEMLEKMEASLSRAKFVAIDNEFSGLRDASKEDIRWLSDLYSLVAKI